MFQYLFKKRGKHSEDKSKEDKSKEDKNKEDKNKEDKNKEDKSNEDKNKEDKSNEDKNKEDKNIEDKSKEDKNIEDRRMKEKSIEDISLEILAPIKGWVCTLEEVNDPVFSEKIMGDGVAIKPLEGKVVAPVDGVVGTVIDTKHAIGIVSNQGTEILIHVGLDTVNLKGAFYESFVQAGDEVKAGDLLITFDMEKIKAKGYDVITPVIICNPSEYSEIKYLEGKMVEQLDVVLVLKK
ncbi:MAG: glucose PTS transporter subunit IIA [Anaerocolumna sp.]